MHGSNCNIRKILTLQITVLPLTVPKCCKSVTYCILVQCLRKWLPHVIECVY